MEMRGYLEKGTDPTGPELYVDCDTVQFPVAIRIPWELEHLRTQVGKQVTFKPKMLGTQRNAATGKMEAIVFATDVTTLSSN
jgi:hypothetical protein